MHMHLDLFYLIHSDIPEFTLQQIFNELIGGKLGLSQKIKTKQDFMVFHWKEDTALKKRNGNNRFIISYL